MSKKITHNDFINILLDCNIHYKNGEFEVIGVYKKMKTKILLKNKYGEHLKTPERLLKGDNLSSKTAINKLVYYRNYIKLNCKNFDLSKYDIIDVNLDGKGNSVIINTKYGVCKMYISNILKGAVPSIKCALNKTNFFVNLLKERGDIGITDYSTIIYKSSSIPVKYMTKFGFCEMTPNGLLFCDRADNINSSLDKTEYVKARILSEKGNLYDLSKLKYKDNDTFITVGCRTHGFFNVYPFNFLGSKSNRGCPKCGRESTTKNVIENPTGWGYKKWAKSGEKSKNFDSFKVYFIECWDEETKETFFKIGRTYLKTCDRFKGNRLPYKYQIIKEFVSNDAEYICKLEYSLKNLNKKNKYVPNISFDGMYECFTRVDYL